MCRYYSQAAFGGLIVSLLFILTGCLKDGLNPSSATKTSAITVGSLSVSAGAYNTNVVIKGTGFSPTASNDQVFFNGKTATIAAASSTQITAVVPMGAGTGNISISINNGTPIIGPVFTYQFTAVVSTVAGNNTLGSANGVGSAASFIYPWGMALDAAGNIYVADIGARLIRKITPDRTVSTFAGGGPGYPIDGKGTAATFAAPTGICFDATGSLYVADNNLIRKITPDGTVSTFYQSYTNAWFTGVAIDAGGNIFVTDVRRDLIMEISPAGIMSTFAGSGIAGEADGKGMAATFSSPVDLTFDKAGNLYVVDQDYSIIRKITPDGTVTTIAGDGARGFVNAIGTASSFLDPTGIAIDASGNIYIGDYGNNIIRKIAGDGTVSTFAGSRFPGHDDGVGTTATFIYPQDLALDGAGNIYVAETGHIRKITMQ